MATCGRSRKRSEVCPADNVAIVTGMLRGSDAISAIDFVLKNWMHDCLPSRRVSVFPGWNYFAIRVDSRRMTRAFTLSMLFRRTASAAAAVRQGSDVNGRKKDAGRSPARPIFARKPPEPAPAVFTRAFDSAPRVRRRVS